MGFFKQIRSDQEVAEEIRAALQVPTSDRMWQVADGFRVGLSTDELYAITHIDSWFLEEIRQLVELEHELSKERQALTPELYQWAKKRGFADERLSQLLKQPIETIQAFACQLDSPFGVTYKRVDTCAAEFEAHTPYLYSSYGSACEARVTNQKKVIILGGGPNRIGQGIEFDYCCVHSAMALQEEGIETIMVNCNPETVSTDYDISDRLYFEPLTMEDVTHILEVEKPFGIIVQFGGQTPLKLSWSLAKIEAPILGTSPDAIDRAEDRKRFNALIHELALRQPKSGMAHSHEEAHHIAEKIQYPVMARPSYVLGGRAMQIIYDSDSLERYLQAHALNLSKHPVLIDHYLDGAIEVDVDAISDGKHVVVAGIMEHVEMAGIHSGDSACSLPPYSLKASLLDVIKEQTVALAKALNVIGLMNIQFAVQDDQVFVLEVNPRASRTVPFVSKTIGVPLAKLATKVMVGRTLEELGFLDSPVLSHMSVKEAVFPFTKLGAADVLLGPEMRSTGEVMGIDGDFGWAFAKSQAAAGNSLPKSGTVLLSVKDSDKPGTVDIAQRLRQLGFTLQATNGTATLLRQHDIEVESVNKMKEGRPHIVDVIKNGQICVVVNTVGSSASQDDSTPIRKEALYQGIPYFTTIPAAKAAVLGIEAMRKGKLRVRPLQEYQAALKGK